MKGFISAIPEKTFTTYVNLKTAKFDSLEINSLQKKNNNNNNNKKKHSTDGLENFFNTETPVVVYMFPRNENSATHFVN